MSKQTSWRVAPYFIVDDVVATANFYRDKLGFDYDRFWNEPPSFCMAYRKGIIIMLGQLERLGVMRPNHVVDPEGGAWDAYIWIDTLTRSAGSSRPKASTSFVTFVIRPTVAAIST